MSPEEVEEDDMPFLGGNGAENHRRYHAWESRKEIALLYKRGQGLACAGQTV